MRPKLLNKFAPNSVMAAALLFAGCIGIACAPLYAQQPAGQQQPAIILGTGPIVPDQPMPTAAPAVDAAKTPVQSATPASAPNVIFGGEALPVDQKPEKKEPLHVKSLFFNAQDMESIRKAVAAYIKLTSGDNSGDAFDFLNRLRGNDQPKPGQRYFIYPQFYLASLVYHGADDWSVRINGTRLTNKQSDGIPGLKISSINKDDVTLEWMPSDMQKVQEVLRATPNDKINVDSRTGTVSFTLHANQTFSSYVMQVLEGKVMPMMLDLAPKSAKDDNGKDQSPDDKTPKAPGKAPATSGKDFLEDILKGRRK